MASEYLTSMKESVKRSDMLKVDPRIIRVEAGHNVRDFSLADNIESLIDLENSICEIGVQQPLTVRWEAATKTFFLVSGERRLRAVLSLISKGVDIAFVPCLPYTGNNEAQRLMNDLVSNTGKPLSQWEAGNGFRRLVSYGISKEQIAKTVGVTLNYVTRAIELHEAPQEVKQQLAAGQITPAIAVQAVRQHGSKAGAVLAERIKASNGTPVRRERTDVSSEVLAAAQALLAEITSQGWDDFHKGECDTLTVSGEALSKLYAAVNRSQSAIVKPTSLEINNTVPFIV